MRNVTMKLEQDGIAPKTLRLAAEAGEIEATLPPSNSVT